MTTLTQSCASALPPSFHLILDTYTDDSSKSTNQRQSSKASSDEGSRSTGNEISLGGPPDSSKSTNNTRSHNRQEAQGEDLHLSHKPLSPSAGDSSAKDDVSLKKDTLPSNSDHSADQASDMEDFCFDQFMGYNVPPDTRYEGMTAKERFMNTVNEYTGGKSIFTINLQKKKHNQDYLDKLWDSVCEWTEDLHREGASFQINGGKVRSAVGIDLDAFKNSVAILCLAADADADPSDTTTVKDQNVEDKVSAEGAHKGDGWSMERANRSVGTLSYSLRPLLG